VDVAYAETIVGASTSVYRGSATVALVATANAPYRYEIRVVAAQTAGSFDSSVNVVLPRCAVSYSDGVNFTDFSAADVAAVSGITIEGISTSASDL
jgi:hypothetical protein